ncbi:hypothetical protein [Phormidium nigroviride]|uniref:hypothetical protein n=1 Tax=Phormidium nigroviride TaxID=482564 RepID=UPI00167F31C2|nr:hypothetical protein [Oscillatoria nigro-viridis]
MSDFDSYPTIHPTLLPLGRSGNARDRSVPNADTHPTYYFCASAPIWMVLAVYRKECFLSTSFTGLAL